MKPQSILSSGFLYTNMVGFALGATKSGSFMDNRNMPIGPEPVTPQEVATWRRQLGWTRKELADKLDLHFETVKAWERGVNKIPAMLRYVAYCFLEDLPLLVPFPSNLTDDETVNKELWAAWLIEIRKTFNASQEELAPVLGVSVYTLGKWETKVNPVPPYLPYVFTWIQHEKIRAGKRK